MTKTLKAIATNIAMDLEFEQFNPYAMQTLFTIFGADSAESIMKFWRESGDLMMQRAWLAAKYVQK